MRKGETMKRNLQLWSTAMALAVVLLAMTQGVTLAAPEGADTLRSLIERRAGVDALRAEIAKGVNVNEAAGDGTTALHWASYWDELESVTFLLSAGADVNRANDLGVTPLWLASENGNREIALKLLDAGADPNRALLSGETAVMTAARAGHASVVELLLTRGANPNARGTRQQTALMWAASQRHAETVEVLIKHGADVHARSESWKQLWQTVNAQHDAHPDQRVWIEEGGYTPLLFAARVGDVASAKLLVAAGAEVNEKTPAGKNAVLLAVQSILDYTYLPEPYRPGGAGTLSPHVVPPSEGVALIEFLMEKGADPDAIDAGHTALHEAILRHNEDAVRVLLAGGADPNIRVKTESPVRRSSTDFFYDGPFVGATPFWLAARFGQPNVMRLLIKHGADPLALHYVDYWGEGYRYTGFPRATDGNHTALMAAVGMPNGQGYAFRQPGDRVEQEALALEAAKIAVESGVDINAANAKGRTALDGARSSRYSTIVAWLEGIGAKPGTAPPAGQRGGGAR
jgi:ankyrin repeat protein